jgi:hypothetical protein
VATAAPTVEPTHGPPPALPEIQIVPRGGLPFAAAAVVGLIVAIAGNWMWAIDFFHVVGGGAWTTLDLFLGFVLGPIIGRMSIPARIEFSARFMPKLVLLIPTAFSTRAIRATAGSSPRSSSSGSWP